MSCLEVSDMSRQMKDSGIGWIGQIPTEWEVKRLKYLFDFGKGLPITKDNLVNEGTPVISYGQIHAKFNTRVSLDEKLFRYVKDSYIETNKNSLVKEGDIIVADTSEDLEGCGNSAYVDRNMTLFAGYHTIVLKSKNGSDNKYLAYQMNTDSWRNQIRCKVFGVKIFSITKKILNDVTYIVPSISEKEEIVEYLDEKCAYIDSVIEKTKETIEEYKKLKQSIITQAVTKGVRGDRPMKDSGIECVKEIPFEWKVMKVRNIGVLQNGISKSGECFGKGYPFVSYVDVYNNFVVPTEVDGLVETTDEEREKYSVEKGDIFFTRTSETIEEVGISSVCEKTISNATFAGFLIRVRPFSNEINTSFAKYYFRSEHLRLYLSKEMNLVTRASMSQGLLKGMPVLVPTMNEQLQIAKYLDKKCSNIDLIIEKKEALIEEISMYKKSLIYEYVTGKKEVPQND